MNKTAKTDINVFKVNVQNFNWHCALEHIGFTCQSRFTASGFSLKWITEANAGACLSPGELINLAMFCERIRRKFWPEWFVDCYDFQYDGSSESSEDGGSPSRLPAPRPFSRTDSFEEEITGSSLASSCLTDMEATTDESLFNSDMETEESDQELSKC